MLKIKFLLFWILTCTQLHELKPMQNLYSRSLLEISSPNNLFQRFRLRKFTHDSSGILSVGLLEEREEDFTLYVGFHTVLPRSLELSEPVITPHIITSL